MARLEARGGFAVRWAAAIAEQQGNYRRAVELWRIAAGSGGGTGLGTEYDHLVRLLRGGPRGRNRTETGLPDEDELAEVYADLGTDRDRAAQRERAAMRARHRRSRAWRLRRGRGDAPQRRQARAEGSVLSRRARRRVPRGQTLRPARAGAGRAVDLAVQPRRPRRRCARARGAARRAPRRSGRRARRARAHDRRAARGRRRDAGRSRSLCDRDRLWSRVDRAADQRRSRSRRRLRAAQRSGSRSRCARSERGDKAAALAALDKAAEITPRRNEVMRATGAALPPVRRSREGARDRPQPSSRPILAIERRHAAPAEEAQLADQLGQRARGGRRRLPRRAQRRARSDRGARRHRGARPRSSGCGTSSLARSAVRRRRRATSRCSPRRSPRSPSGPSSPRSGASQLEAAANPRREGAARRRARADLRAGAR